MDKKNDGKAKKCAFSDDQLEVARQLGNDPESVYEMPAEGVDGAAVVEEEVSIEKPDLKAKLKAIKDAPEAKEADKKQADELIARLEELEQAEKNAQKFIDEKAVVAAPAEVPAMPEAPAAPAV